jgi:hypothetical protein
METIPRARLEPELAIKTGVNSQDRKQSSGKLKCQQQLPRVAEHQAGDQLQIHVPTHGVACGTDAGSQSVDCDWISTI